MKIKIIKCSEEVFWYSDKIGKTYDVLSIDDNDYFVYRGDGQCGCLSIDDCEIIEEQDIGLTKLEELTARNVAAFISNPTSDIFIYGFVDHMIKESIDIAKKTLTALHNEQKSLKL